MTTWFSKRVGRVSLVVAGACALLLSLFVAQYIPMLSGWLTVIASMGLVTVRQRTRLSLICVVLCMGSVGLWWGGVVASQVRASRDLYFKKVVLVGDAVDDAVYGERSQLTFTLTHVRVYVPRQQVFLGHITVKGFGESSVYRHDTVRVEGKLYPTRGNNQASISFATLKVLAHHSSATDKVRRVFSAGVMSALPEPTASFGLGLLIGERSTLPDDQVNQLRMTGLSHIIAASGYNLTILVQASSRFLRKRSRFQMTALGLSIIGTFVALAGPSPPIMRAAIISMLSIWAAHYGRRARPFALIMTTAALTAIASPLYIWGNVSWYLSFLAFFGVLIIAPLVVRLWCKKPPGLIGAIVIESCCASLAVTPYVLYVFGQVSVVSLLANVLVVMMVPLAMLLTFIAGMVGVYMGDVAGWFAWPARVLLTYMLDIANVLSRLPHAFVQNISFSLTDLIVVYVTMAIVVILLWRKVARNGIITDEKSGAYTICLDTPSGLLSNAKKAPKTPPVEPSLLS